MAKTARRQLGGRLLLFGECLRRWTNLNVQYRKFSTSLLAQYFTLTRILKSIQGRAGGWGGGYSTNVYTGRFRPAIQPLTLLYTIFHEKSSLRKQTTFRDATNGFPAKWRLRNKRRNSILMTRHYSDLGSASDWLKQISLVKSLPFRTPEAWKRYPVRAEPPGIGHHRLE